MAVKWMIYGANGYTGELIAREAVKRGLQPIVAGRNRHKVESLAAQLSLNHQIFGLEDLGEITRNLEGVEIVLHCAGPFSATSAPMIQACLNSHTHYLDITGEISVFEYAQQQDARARNAGVVICPGAGFDVIPTDCLAARLKQALPDATQLRLGFDSRSGLSPGTAKTSVEGLALGGRIRKQGKITKVPLAYQTRNIDFGDGEKCAMSIPWGDVATAYFSTGIPNIEVYIPSSPKQIRMIRRLNWIRPLLGWRWVQRWLKSKVEAKVYGPSEQKRAASPTYVWGEASNANGDKVSARIKTANGYDVTISGALALVEVLSQADSPQLAQGGYFTPSRLTESNLITRLPGSGEFEISQTDKG